MFSVWSLNRAKRPRKGAQWGGMGAWEALPAVPGAPRARRTRYCPRQFLPELASYPPQSARSSVGPPRAEFYPTPSRWGPHVICTRSFGADDAAGVPHTSARPSAQPMSARARPFKVSPCHAAAPRHSNAGLQNGASRSRRDGLEWATGSQPRPVAPAVLSPSRS